MDSKPEIQKYVFPVPRTNPLNRLNGGTGKTIEGSSDKRKHIKEWGRESAPKRNYLLQGLLIHFALQMYLNKVHKKIRTRCFSPFSFASVYPT